MEILQDQDHRAGGGFEVDEIEPGEKPSIAHQRAHRAALRSAERRPEMAAGQLPDERRYSVQARRRHVARDARQQSAASQLDRLAIAKAGGLAH